LAISWRTAAAVAAVGVAFVAVAWALLAARPHAPGALQGRVVALNDGQPVPQAAVTATLPAGAPGPRAVTVFTDAEGRYRLDGLTGSAARTSIRLTVRKLGYEQVVAKAGASRLYLEPVANLAPDAPASAWLAQLPEGQDKNITIASCSSCHQVLSPRMREFAAKIEAVRGGPDGDRAALQTWRKLVRHEAWRTVVKYMRAKHYAVFPLESAMSLDAIDWPTSVNTDLNFFNSQQGERIAAFLATNLSTAVGSVHPDDYRPAGPIGATSRTVIREYALPADALVRELVFAPNSKFLWGADVRRNLILRLDPSNGQTRWFRVDFKGSTGPHTIVPDASGRLWVSMVDNDQFGMFDPRTERWKLWTLRPSNLPKNASMGGAAIVHDMSIDQRGYLARDPKGRIWITLVGTNQMGTLNPDSGEITFNDTNTIPGLSPINHLIYSTVLSADGRCAWYSQVNGHVSCLDTETMRVARMVRFPEGAGPRRMARDRAGNLWVALFGAGQVARIDMQAGKVVQTVDLPDRGSAPYAVTWDERRQAVWVATANSDAIYRISARTGAVTTYPLPRRMAYLRQLSIDEATGRLAASYGNYPAGSGPSMALLIDVGE
jgi:streptogramin lyase